MTDVLFEVKHQNLCTELQEDLAIAIAVIRFKKWDQDSGTGNAEAGNALSSSKLDSAIHFPLIN